MPTTRFILQATDPSDLPWTLTLAQKALTDAEAIGSSSIVTKGRNPQLKALVRVNPKSISVHCQRRNSP